MSEIFQFCFSILTDQLSLPLNPLIEFIFLALISQLAYKWTFSFIGELYHAGIISGRLAGSFLHWFFRLICFIAIWVITYFGIIIGRFIGKHWLYIIIGIGITLFLIIVSAYIYRLKRISK